MSITIRDRCIERQIELERLHRGDTSPVKTLRALLIERLAELQDRRRDGIDPHRVEGIDDGDDDSADG